MNSRPQKRRRVSPSRSNDEERPSRSNGGGVNKAFLQNAANWSLEDNYEKRAQKKRKAEKKKSDRLPIRMEDGVIEDAPLHPADDEDDEDDKGSDEDVFGSEDDDTAVDADEEERQKKAAEPQLSEAEQIRIAKEELARLALLLNESPEENPAAFKALAMVGRNTKSLAVQKLCIVTQVAVYKDVIPGYQIRTFEEESSGKLLSSEVKKLRNYEQSLLVGYQHYLRDLARYAKSRTPSGGGGTKRGPPISDVALTCACTLIGSVPHFNFREELIRILVGKLSTRRVDTSFDRCREAFENLFHDDEEGRPSMEVVSVLSKMMKARNYQVDESVLNTFLHLRLIAEFAGKGSQEGVDRDTSNGFGKKLKQKKEFRTKRERKAMKEQKALDKDMAQADALVAHEERDRMQSETLKLVFATYFRILKMRTPHLMGAVLEGLAKYAHLINQDFFGDVLEALKDLIRHSEEDARLEAQGGDDGDDEGGAVGNNDDDDFAITRNPSREALLCTVTAYTLLAGQDAHNAKGDLYLDLSFFTRNLFRSLFPLALSPDIEKHANSLQQQLEDAQEGKKNYGAKVNLQTTTVLLIRCLTAVMLPSYNIRSVPPLRLAAFTKQIMTTSLHVPEKSCQALLALLDDVVHTHSKKISALWNTEERKGDGTFNPQSETIEGSNPFSTTIWEGELLRRHYCPKVREAIRTLEKDVTM